MTPFFQNSHRSLAYQFTVNAPLLCPLFSIFRKFLHFQPCFGQNSSSLDPNFSKFLFLRPLFFKENPLPRPYILKPAWHTSTKNKLSAPPPPPPGLFPPCPQPKTSLSSPNTIEKEENHYHKVFSAFFDIKITQKPKKKYSLDYN